MKATLYGLLSMAAALVAFAALRSAIAQGVTPNPSTPDGRPAWGPGAVKTPGAGGAKTAEQLVKVRSVADVTEIKPGEKFHLAFVFDIEPHWHIYWKNSGDSGAPTEIKVTGPAGYTISDVQFPRPSAFEEPEGTVYGYDNRTVLFVEVTAPSQAKLVPMAVFRADIGFLVCKDICLMGRASQTITIPDSAGSAQMAELKADIDAFTARLPSVIKHGENGVSITASETELTISLPAGGASSAQFFPYDSPGITYGKVKVSTSDDAMTILIPIEVNENNAQGKPVVSGGFIGFGTSPDGECFEFTHPLSAS